MRVVVDVCIFGIRVLMLWLLKLLQGPRVMLSSAGCTGQGKTRALAWGGVLGDAQGH